MINIQEKEYCCGCETCVQWCPKHCISLQEDNEGFLYPIVNKERCIDCGLCENVCPELHPYKKRYPLHSFAAINTNNNVRMQSSSGGVFTLLAEKVLAEGGVVFGARFDENWNVIMDYTEDVVCLADFRGSKYVQARTGDTFRLCEKFLKDGRKVLYSGTPCQIYGLHLFLNISYPNLLTVDVACHGVPSPDVWKKYLKCEVLQYQTAHRIANGKSTVCHNLMSFINDIKFRDKVNGWKKYRFVIKFNEPCKEAKKSSVLSYIHYKNPYFHAFNMGLIMRPSCYGCIIKNSCRSLSDITLADFWGIEKINMSLDDDRGTSLVLVNSIIGSENINKLDLKIKEVDYDKVLLLNAGLRVGCKKHPKREEFFKNYKKENYNVKYKLNNLLKDSIIIRMFWRIRGVISKIKNLFRTQKDKNL